MSGAPEKRGHLTPEAAIRLGVEPGPVVYTEAQSPEGRTFARHIYRDGVYLGGIVSLGPVGVLPAEGAE